MKYTSAYLPWRAEGQFVLTSDSRTVCKVNGMEIDAEYIAAAVNSYSPPRGKYVIENDDSGHYYIIPREQVVLWNMWIGSDAWEQGDVPTYAIRIDSTRHVSFDTFIIE